MRSLDPFHVRCLRCITKITWQDKIPNTEVLRICEIPGTEAFVIKAQLRWVGHVRRMSDSRCQDPSGRSVGRQYFRARAPAPRA